MFAHQVIEEVKNSRVIDKEGLTLKMFEAIKRAQHFHLGEYNSIRNLFKNDEGKEIFSERTYLKPPYKKMFFDCLNFRNPKFDYSEQDMTLTFCDKYAALLDVSENGTWTVCGAFHFQCYKHWQIFPMIQHVSLGSHTTVIPQLLQYNGLNYTHKMQSQLAESGIDILMLIYCGISYYIFAV